MVLRTVKNSFHLLRFRTTVDATLLETGTTGYNMLTKPAGAVSISSLDINYMEIIAAIQNSAGDTVEVNIYAGRGNKGPARLVANLLWTGGTQEVVNDPESGVAQGTGSGIDDMDLYCDTVTITEDRWLTNVTKGNDQGNDRIASFLFDPLGYDWLHAEIKILTGAEAVKLWWTSL